MNIDFKLYTNNTLNQKIIQEVINNAYNTLGTIDQFKLMGLNNDKPERFSFVIALPLPFMSINWNDFIGFLVQIREKQAPFGTDCVLIRTPNGKLQNWGNQSFLILPNDEVLKILPFFQKLLKEDKEYIADGGMYTINGLKPHNAYIVK